MKLLVVTGIFPPTPGGPATYSKLLLDELPERDFEVDVLTFDSVRKFPKGISHLIFIFKLFFKSIGKDLLYVQDPISVGFPTYIVSKILNKKYVLKMVGDYAWEQSVQRFGITDLLDDFVEKKYKNKKVNTLKRIQKTVAENSIKIITPSNYLKEIVTKWGIKNPEDKIEVIYNSFHISGDKDLKRESYKDKTIVSVSRLVPWKGFDTLIKMMPTILEEHPTATLKIIGEGPEKSKLEDLIKQFGLKDSVVLTGKLKREEVLEEFSKSEVFVLNTAYEGLSHLLLEALAVGIPIITTDVGGNPELIKDKENGLLIEYNNEEEILESVNFIFYNKYESMEFVKNGKELPEYFSKDYMLSKLEKTLKNII